MIIMKVSGSSNSAPASPWSSSRNANSAEMAAATMPRGAIQASSARSRQLSVEPQVDTATLTGRATN